VRPPVADLEVSPGYRKFGAPTFKQGLTVLLENVACLREAFHIQDTRRAPASPARLLHLIKHLHTHRHLGKITYTLDSRRTPILGAHGDTLAPGPQSSELVIFLKDGWVVGADFGDDRDRGPAVFFYRHPPAKVMVQAEGLLEE